MMGKRFDTVKSILLETTSERRQQKIRNNSAYIAALLGGREIMLSTNGRDSGSLSLWAKSSSEISSKKVYLELTHQWSDSDSDTRAEDFFSLVLDDKGSITADGWHTFEAAVTNSFNASSHTSDVAISRRHYHSERPDAWLEKRLDLELQLGSDLLKATDPLCIASIEVRNQIGQSDDHASMPGSPANAQAIAKIA